MTRNILEGYPAEYRVGWLRNYDFLSMSMRRRITDLIIDDPLRIPLHLWSKLYLAWLSQRGNVEIQGKLHLIGHPMIDIRKGCMLYVGAEVTLNSRNRGYHINMQSPVKLFADRPGAQIHIGDRTRIHGTCIHAYQSIAIGKNCLIAANCQIFDGNGHDLSFPNVDNRINTVGGSRPIVIEDSVWIGANSIVLPGVTIGRGSIVSAGSVVTKDIPPMVIAGGNPAIVVRDYRAVDKQINDPSGAVGAPFGIIPDPAERLA